MPRYVVVVFSCSGFFIVCPADIRCLTQRCSGIGSDYWTFD